MACNCECKTCENFITATAVTVSGGVATIEVSADFEPKARNTYCFLLRVPIATSSECNSVSISNGAASWPVLQCEGSNWRPCKLKCRTVIKARFLDDPPHFLFKQVRR